MEVPKFYSKKINLKKVDSSWRMWIWFDVNFGWRRWICSIESGFDYKEDEFGSRKLEEGNFHLMGKFKLTGRMWRMILSWGKMNLTWRK